mgnify:CR=1 FL=1
MNRAAISVVFAGSGGAGAMTAGAILLGAGARCGYYGVMTQLFGAQVRGGESAALIQLSIDPVDAQPDTYDVFVALDWEKIEQFAPEIPLNDKSTVFTAKDGGKAAPSVVKSKARILEMEMTDPGMTQLERALRGKRINVFAAGLIGALVGLNESNLWEALNENLGRMKSDVVASNKKALAAGINAAKQRQENFRLAPVRQNRRWLITGNQAIALGALRGGVRFVGCYPITPATDLVEWLAPALQKLGGKLVLGEDELASINMVLGASFGGVPAMTVTSGPGLSLMVETIGLAVAAEVPAVLINVMRGGPSTGIPSKTEQSDINLAVYGGHGDAPRIVLAPMSVADCIFTSEWAVYAAEAYQTPVIVLSDQLLGQARQVIEPSAERPRPVQRRTDSGDPKLFKRYMLSDDPVSPMTLPGTPEFAWVGDGLTHNEMGVPVSSASAHAAQMQKRARKIAQFNPGKLWGEVWGEGETTIITFGSSIAPAREAAKRLATAGHSVRVIGLRVISPVPAEALKEALKGVRRVFVLEQNLGAQLYHYLLSVKGLPVATESIAHTGPLPFRPAEIAAHLV